MASKHERYDLDLDAGSVRVVRALQRGGGRAEFVEPKSAHSRRVVRFPSFMGELLRAHRARQAEEQLAAGTRRQEHGLVFTTTEGAPLEGMNLAHHFQR